MHEEEKPASYHRVAITELKRRRPASSHRVTMVTVTVARKGERAEAARPREKGGCCSPCRLPGARRRAASQRRPVHRARARVAIVHSRSAAAASRVCHRC
ncbi:uncharacterized protein DS421_11g336150 [Arachis hypogaea]|nr:uncharacterized protein DS421_11g336150 [Arachis hypogaea]